MQSRPRASADDTLPPAVTTTIPSPPPEIDPEAPPLLLAMPPAPSVPDWSGFASDDLDDEGAS